MVRMKKYKTTAGSTVLRNATAFIMPLGGENLEEILEGLNQAAPYLSGILCRSVQLKYSPKLKFKTDESFAETKKINELLANPKVARDLKD